MKKIAIILALVAMTASLAGCTDEKEEGTTTSTTTSAVVSEDKPEAEDTSTGSENTSEGEGTISATSESADTPQNSEATSDSAVSDTTEGTTDTPRKKPIEDEDDIDPLSDDINHHEYVESSVRDTDEIEGN